MANAENRYKMDVFHARSLEGNPLQAPTDRKIKIYLPPEYFSAPDKRFPVIYLLHGYGGSAEAAIIGTKQDVKDGNPLLFRILLRKFFKNLLTFEKIDDLMASGQLSSFILVQPGGNLPLTHIHGIKGRHGEIASKGSFYVNSPYTGNFGDYVFGDLIDYMDSHYRTKVDKAHRAIVGGSMGGYGALYGAMLNSKKFQAIYALSPAISWLELIDNGMIIPLYSLIYGKRKSAALGRKEIEDIIDTADLIFSRDLPLLPSIQRDAQGKIESFDKNAEANWLQWDLKVLAKHHVEDLKSVQIAISCEEQDEYQFAHQIRAFQTVLKDLGIPHTININDDAFAAKVSPHSIGIAQQLLPALAFCAQHFPTDHS
jgi:pimeloyl-ACP methyl ester carboxylesterase